LLKLSENIQPIKSKFFIFLVFFVSSCSHYLNENHLQTYQYLDNIKETKPTTSPYEIIFLVDAPHLDYSNTQLTLKSLAKHPSNGYDERFGHAWICLKRENKIFFEGGHTGAFGEIRPSYFEGIWDGIENNSLNAISYLWKNLNDGRLQHGNGGHNPTYAVKLPISEQQFFSIFNFIKNSHYQFSSYSLTGNQCCQFVMQCAALIEIELPSYKTLEIESHISFNNKKVQLWENTAYSSITIALPDILEKQLVELTNKKKGETVTNWYLKKYPVTLPPLWKRLMTKLKRLSLSNYF
jgi:hypothetical protein